MAVRVDIQRTAAFEGLPSDARIADWIERVLAGLRPDATLALRIVDEAEGAELNGRWRGKPGRRTCCRFPPPASRP